MPNDALEPLLRRLRVAGDAAVMAAVDGLLDRLRAGDLRVVLAGEAKRGKSTLGNALAGRALLPTGVTPVTALATVIAQGSPERLEVDLAGGTRTLGLADLPDFVTQQANPANKRGAREVRAYLPEGLPVDRMVLIDTPGVGSVFGDNSVQTATALESMDVALFVLTADAPMSASETEMLHRLARLSVEVIVLLNKADLLSDADRDEATDFVRGCAAEVLGREPEVLLCSGRAGLAARSEHDPAGWKRSGLSDVVERLARRVEGAREATLSASIAAAAARVARHRLDAVRVEAAALGSVRDERVCAIDEFGAAIGRLRQAGDDAADLLAQELARQRGALDAQAAGERRQVLAKVRGDLATLERESATATVAGLEERGSAVIEESAGPAVLDWRAQARAELDDALRRHVQRQQQELTAADASVAASIEELLGVRLEAEVPRLPEDRLAAPDFDFRPEVGWNHATTTTLRHHGPGARRRTTRFLDEEASRLVDKQVGRILGETRALLDETGRRMAASLRTAFGSVLDGLGRAEDAARTAAGRSHSELAPRLRELSATETELRALLDAFEAAPA